MQAQEKHGGVYNGRDTGKSFEWLSGFDGGRASSCLLQRLLMPQAGGGEVDRTRRGQVERVSPPHLHQQGDCTEHWDRAGIAPISLPPFQLPKEVPRPKEGYFKRKMTGCCYMAQSFGTARVIFKVK